MGNSILWHNGEDIIIDKFSQIDITNSVIEKGFTGKQGVIIPIQNVDNLMLKKEIVDKVKEGTFKIYPVKHKSLYHGLCPVFRFFYLQILQHVFLNLYLDHLLPRQ